LSACGVPYACEPNKMILSGWNCSATCRAKRRIAALGTSFPRYQRVGLPRDVTRRLVLMKRFYHVVCPLKLNLETSTRHFLNTEALSSLISRPRLAPCDRRRFDGVENRAQQLLRRLVERLAG